MDRHARDGDVEGAADRPQHGNEGRGGEERVQHAGEEIDRGFGCDPHVVADAVLRVLMLAAHQIELIIASGGEPVVDDAVGKPAPPRPLQGHTAVDLRDVHADARRQQHEIDERQKQDGLAVLVLQRVEHRVGSRDVEKDDEQQAGGQAPGDRAATSAPEGARSPPEAAQQITAPQPLGFLLRFLLVLLERIGRRNFLLLIGPAHLFPPWTRHAS